MNAAQPPADASLVFSRFSHSVVRSDTYALYNALRLRPVFLTRSLFAEVEKAVDAGLDFGVINSTASSDLPPNVHEAIIQLVQNKILVPGKDYDDQVLARYRSLLGKPSIRVAYFIMSDQCNFDCTYCFIKKEQREGGRKLFGNMGENTARAAVSLYARLLPKDVSEDDCMIIFYGGEPLLNFAAIKAAVKRVEELKSSGELASAAKMAIVTNGSLMTDEIAEFLGKHGVGIGISVDGDEVATNSNRKRLDGGSAYAGVMDAIQTCRRNKIDDVSLSVTISEACLAEFDATMDFVEKYADAKSFGFNLLMSPNDDDYIERASRYLIRAFERCREKGIYEDRMMRKVGAFVDGKVHLCDCAASGGNQIVVAPDGMIGICHGFLGTKTYFSGSVFDQNFDPGERPDFLEWARRAPINIKECQDCPALGICGGGCPFISQKENGSLWALDERFCVHTRMTMEWLIWDLFDKVATAR